ncbi:hypothetical protein [Leptospira sarikeiensis]|uniref:DUF1570 domain-containing protein n=1 Tax=Leptospira sarikeiensis TaxID=2484943 RepID=A0A4R9K6B9_9LEPT|nr:hypothetical protein [Leptospira sarikeiensis]TGL60867.1 hypothetical protein EHQ64_13740 [Leptospira sarikeiensis]
MKPFNISSVIYIIFIIFFSEDLFSQTTRRKIDGYEFFFLQEFPSNDHADRVLVSFSEKFLKELKTESDRLERRVPQDAKIFVSSDSNVFRKHSGQPTYSAAFYSPEKNQFFFQNPESLSKRGILDSVIQHEICHFLAPGSRSETSSWMQESYCESLYPTNPKPSSLDLKFPYSWEKFDEECIRDIKSRNETKRRILYQKIYIWGSWLLKTKGEARFRFFLENQIPEIQTIYSQFIKSRY